MSAKVKLMSVISLFILMLGVLILGVFAVGSQTIHLDGNVNFNVGDKSLWVKDVRLKEDMSSDPVSLKETGRFMPGYINEILNMSLGDENINSYGSIMLYFDIINTVDSEGKSSMYTVSATTTQNGVTVSAVVDNTQGYIPAGTVAPEDITSSMAETATIVVTISGAEGTTVDLSQITITLTIYELEVYDFTFTINEDSTATLDTYTGDGGDVVIPSTFSTRVVDGQTQYISGNDYTVTAIAAGSSSNGPFYSAQSTLTSITIPETIKTIGDYAFYNCTYLTEINYNAIEANDLSDFNHVFSYAGQDGEGITVNIGENVTKIPNYNFCSGLYMSSSVMPKITTVNFAENSVCTSIGTYAFYRCSSLTSIAIPASVTSIGDRAFRDCSGLTLIDVDQANENYSSEDGVLFNEDKTILIQYPIGNTRISYTIAEGVTSIGTYAFYRCSSLTSIAIPTSVTSISSSAFSDCSGLTSVDFGENSQLTSISSSAFRECRSLTSITIPDSVTSISSYAFSYCSGLTTITIPEGVTSISNSTFSSCNNLISITIPEGVTSIGDWAFQGCSSLISITIPDSVTSIGDSAFRDCGSLTSIAIPASVTSIVDHAFQWCNFSTVTIDSSYAYQNAGESSDACGYLLEDANTVYVNANLVGSYTASSYLTSNFTRSGTANEDGYYIYTRNA